MNSAPRLQPPKKPGEPFIPLSEAEAEWLVRFGWQARKKLRQHKPPPKLKLHDISPPDSLEDEEIDEIERIFEPDPLAPAS